MTAAAFSTAPPDTAVAPLDFKVNYLRPVFPDGNELTARARILHRGRTLVDRRRRDHQRRGQAGGPRHGLLDVPAGPAREPGRGRARLGLLRPRGRSRLAVAVQSAVGLFGFLRKKDERAMPGARGRPSSRPPSQGTAMPDSAERLDGRAGLDRARAPSQTIDLRGDRASGEEIEEVLREHGIDPDKKGQTIDASRCRACGRRSPGARSEGVPNSGGFGGGVSAPKQDPPTGRSDRSATPARSRGRVRAKKQLARRRLLDGPGSAGRSSASAPAGAASRAA